MRGGTINKDPTDNLWKITSASSTYADVNTYRVLEEGLLNRFARSSYYLDSRRFLEKEYELFIHNYALLCKAARKQPEDILLEEARGHKEAIEEIIRLRRKMNDIYPESHKTKTHSDRIECWEVILPRITSLFDSLEKEKTAKKQKEKEERDRVDQRVKEKIETKKQKTEKRARLDIIYEELARFNLEQRMDLSQRSIKKIVELITALELESTCWESMGVGNPLPMDDEMRTLHDTQLARHKEELVTRKKYYASLKIKFDELKPLRDEKDVLERELADVLGMERAFAKKIIEEEKAAEATKKAIEEAAEKEKEEREEREKQEEIQRLQKKLKEEDAKIKAEEAQMQELDEARKRADKERVEMEEAKTMEREATKKAIADRLEQISQVKLKITEIENEIAAMALTENQEFEKDKEHQRVKKALAEESEKLDKEIQIKMAEIKKWDQERSEEINTSKRIELSSKIDKKFRENDILLENIKAVGRKIDELFKVQEESKLAALESSKRFVILKRKLTQLNQEAQGLRPLKECHNPLCPKLAKLDCMGCKKVGYCGKDCQQLDWKAHKAFCKANRAGGTKRKRVIKNKTRTKYPSLFGKTPS